MDNDLIKKIRRLSQQHAFSSIQMHEAVARKVGLPGTDHKYLGFFIQKGLMTAGELSILTGLTPGAVTGLIDRFEKKKLLKRKFDKGDRRKVFIVPNTKNIMALFEPLYKEYRKSTEELIASFSVVEIGIIESYFSKTIEIMDATTQKVSRNSR